MIWKIPGNVQEDSRDLHLDLFREILLVFIKCYDQIGAKLGKQNNYRG